LPLSVPLRRDARCPTPATPPSPPTARRGRPGRGSRRVSSTTTGLRPGGAGRRPAAARSRTRAPRAGACRRARRPRAGAIGWERSPREEDARSMALQINATNPEHPALLLELPWHLPLEEWPEEYLVPLPRGISRHVVRYARAGDEVVAVKELAERPAQREYGLLRDLDRIEIPAVDPLAVVTGRTDAAGEPLERVLVTRQLAGSLPYRSLFETTLRPATMHRLMDALAVLLVRLHLAGFAWSDCSLSNTLFRRDAGAYAAYLVDAETGDLHPELTTGQRDYDLELARVNISGELMDLEASGALHPSVDPVEFGSEICARYEGLWQELTRTSVYPAGKYHYIERRIRRLNALGFDVAEMQIEHSPLGDSVTFVPKVVDAGHHPRQLLRLTGLDAEENQARRLLSDLESWMATQ